MYQLYDTNIFESETFGKLRQYDKLIFHFANCENGNFTNNNSQRTLRRIL